VGGKLLGAGGGGFLLLFVEPELRARVRAALADLPEVPFAFESEGSRVLFTR
jgi:D-glycero-alpha-D-manno-heptose-7-phosphate kinase